MVGLICCFCSLHREVKQNKIGGETSGDGSVYKMKAKWTIGVGTGHVKKWFLLVNKAAFFDTSRCLEWNNDAWGGVMFHQVCVSLHPSTTTSEVGLSQHWKLRTAENSNQKCPPTKHFCFLVNCQIKIKDPPNEEGGPKRESSSNLTRFYIQSKYIFVLKVK